MVLFCGNISVVKDGYMEILSTEQIDEIVNVIAGGGIVALPTDTIYGFSCLATNNDAINRLCKLKNRDDGKQFILLVSSKYNLDNLIVCDDKIKEFIDTHTPNNLTMIVNKKRDLELADIFELPTLAIRIPNNAFVEAILDKVGYMVSTSCNLQGEPFLNDYCSIINAFPSIDAVVRAETKDASPSTIVDLTADEFKVVRQGEYIID